MRGESYVPYSGDGSDFSNPLIQEAIQTWTTLAGKENFELGVIDRRTVPKSIIQANGRLLLTASDFVIGESGARYGHYIDVSEKDGVMILRSSYVDDCIFVRFADQVSLEINKLAKPLNDRRWLEL